MRVRSWKLRLGLVVSTTLLGAGALAPIASAAPAVQPAQVLAGHHGSGSGNSLGKFLGGSGSGTGGVKIGHGSVRVGDNVCAGRCNGTVNG
ncbi:hypothetical protein VR44_38180, partial [Streptomyces katrae]